MPLLFLQAVIHFKFQRMRCHTDTADIFFFEGDVAVDPVFAEHTAAQEEFVSALRAASASSKKRKRLAPMHLLPRQVVQVFIGRVARMDFVLNTVQTGHQQSGKCQVWVGGRIRKRASIRRALLLFTDGMRMEAERFLAEYANGSALQSAARGVCRSWWTDW